MTRLDRTAIMLESGPLLLARGALLSFSIDRTDTEHTRHTRRRYEVLIGTYPEMAQLATSSSHDPRAVTAQSHPRPSEPR